MTDNPFHCMNCGCAEIQYIHCKIRCPNCGFMLDCSDLDVGGEVMRRAQRHTKSYETLNSPAEVFPDNGSGES